MAVQAHYPSNAFSPNFKTDGSRDASNALEDDGRRIGSVLNYPNIDVIVFNASGSRKRGRAVDSSMIQHFHVPSSSKVPKSGGFLQPDREIDAFIGLHNTKLRSDVCRIQAKHYNQLLRVIENQASKRIAEKDSELASLKREQAKLEDRLNQVTNEHGFWYAAARNSEATVSALKASLDQVLAERHVASSDEADAESCCYGGDNQIRSMCRACGELDSSVLVLPCRHLCLCVGCEPGMDTCPICYGAKSVGMQVFLD